MRSNDVENLLAHVEKSLVNIKNTYDQSLYDKTIPPFLPIDIKNVMENLRSALDYAAKDIATIVCKMDTALPKKIYFPYGKNKQNSDSLIEKNLPNLKIAHPDIHSLIESVQPHACCDTWLYDFCQILNNNKHDCLSPQTRISQKTYSIGLKGKPPTISAPAGAIAAEPGAISINGVPIEFNPNTGIPYQTSELEVAVTTWVSFVFQGTSVEVYPLLQTAFNNIKQISEQLYKKLKDTLPMS